MGVDRWSTEEENQDADPPASPRWRAGAGAGAGVMYRVQSGRARGGMRQEELSQQRLVFLCVKVLTPKTRRDPKASER